MQVGQVEGQEVCDEARKQSIAMARINRLSGSPARRRPVSRGLQESDCPKMPDTASNWPLCMIWRHLKPSFTVCSDGGAGSSCPSSPDRLRASKRSSVSIYQLVYYSRNTVSQTSTTALNALRSIIKVSQANNARDAITGYLIMDSTCFLQILEGDKSAIFKTFRRIEADPRHADVVVVGSRDVSMRSFENWTMAGALRTIDQDEIFIKYGIGREIVPARLNAKIIVALAQELQASHVSMRHATSAWPA